MKDFIFSLGLIDKKLIWTLIYTISQILRNLINNKYLKDKQHNQLDNIGGAIGQILIILIPFFTYKNQNKSKEKKCTKKNFLYIFLLLLFDLVFHLIVYVNVIVTNAPQNHHDSYFCAKVSAEIILITLVTFIFLKYKYFIHHIISLIIFCIIGVCIDFLLNNWEDNLLSKPFLQIIFYFIIILLEIVNYSYQKYMMDKLYFHYWNITLATGLSLFTQTFGSLVSNLIKKDEKTINLFHELKPGYIILGFFLNIIIGFIQYLSRILILDYFTPNHMMIAYELLKIYHVLIKSPSENKYYSLIFFVLQFFILMFYLEIFEFNFCKLNENTKRNIQNRAVSEGLIDNKSSKSQRSTLIELGTDYILKGNENNKSETGFSYLNSGKDQNSSRSSQISEN